MKISPTYDLHQKLEDIEGPYVRLRIQEDVPEIKKQTLIKLFDVLGKGQESKYDKTLYSNLFCNDGFDDIYILHRPYCSFGYLAFKETEKENNPYHLIGSHHAFWALQNVLQYGIGLHQIGVRGDYYYSHHTRLVHSLDTAFNAEIIARKLGLDENQVITLIIAGLLHDIATPKFSDVTMKAFPDLKEEKNFLSYMNTYPDLVNDIQKYFAVSMEEISTIVNDSKSFYGHILDIADKFAYTARDLDQVYSDSNFQVPQIFGGSDKFAHAIGEILSRNRRPFDVLLSVSLSQDGKRVVFDDKQSLLDVLFLRSYMHNMIYLNKHVRGKEYLVGLILRYLVEKNIVSPSDLQHKRFLDENFFTYNDQGIVPDIIHQLDSFYAIDICTSYDDAAQLLKTHIDKNVIAFVIKTPSFKPGETFLTRDGSGIQKSIAEIFPQETKSIQKLGKSTDGYALVSIRSEDVPYLSKNFSNFFLFLQSESKKNISQFFLKK